MNPLLEKFNTPFETAPFPLIKNEHFLPAIEAAIQQAKEEISQIKKAAHPNFVNTIVHLENSGEKLSRAASIFFNLNAAETNDEIQNLAREISPLLSAHSNDVLLDQDLFDRIQQIHSQKEKLNLSTEENTLLEKTYKSFIRNGALLDADGKKRLREIDQKLSKLGLQFGENVLKETNSYELVISDEEDLEGLPEGIIEAAAQTAEERGKAGKWVFTLAYPSYIPFMTYAASRELRKKLFIAYNTKASKGDALDNRGLIKEMIQLKDERAKLLGYSDYSAFVLEERMAKDEHQVMDFLDELLKKARPKAVAEMQELEAFARERDGLEKLQKWDVGYYAEKLKMKKFDVDDELLKPYFELNSSIQGVFQTARKLFGITFEENSNIPVYHKDVKAYEVKDESGAHLAVFYADFFPGLAKETVPG